MDMKELKQIDINEVDAFKFSDTATEKPTLNDSTVFDFLNDKYTHGMVFGIENLKAYGGYKLMGWFFNFRPYLNLYVVKQYDNWYQAYAPNKTMLRNTIYGRIDKIVEVV